MQNIIFLHKENELKLAKNQKDNVTKTGKKARRKVTTNKPEIECQIPHGVVSSS